MEKRGSEKRGEGSASEGAALWAAACRERKRDVRREGWGGKVPKKRANVRKGKLNKLVKKLEKRNHTKGI